MCVCRKTSASIIITESKCIKNVNLRTCSNCSYRKLRLLYGYIDNNMLLHAQRSLKSPEYIRK